MTTCPVCGAEVEPNRLYPSAVVLCSDCEQDEERIEMAIHDEPVSVLRDWNALRAVLLAARDSIEMGEATPDLMQAVQDYDRRRVAQ